jgi:hypothetical protein
LSSSGVAVPSARALRLQPHEPSHRYKNVGMNGLAIKATARSGSGAIRLGSWFFPREARNICV